MAKKTCSSSAESRQRTLPLELCRPESNNVDLNGSDGAMTQSCCSTLQSPQAISDQTGEDCNRSAHDSPEITIPGIDYVIGKTTEPERPSSSIQQQASGNGSTSGGSDHNLGQRQQQSPSASGSCVSTSKTRHHYGEPINCSCYNLEITNHGATGFPLLPGSEDSGRPRAVLYEGSGDIGNEGLCHIYSDGTYIPAYVNGVRVDPELGLTKIGNPRKRLGRACINCNSKKVKCERGLSKCRQCEKTQIDCIYPPVSSSTGIGAKSKSSLGSPRRVPHHKPSRKKQGIVHSVDLVTAQAAEDRARGDCYNEANSSPALTKKHKVGARASVASPSRADLSHSYLLSGPMTSEGLSITGSQSPAWADFSWERDPVNVNERLTIRLLDFFFAYVNLICYSLLPYQAFMRWVRTCERKTMDDKMLLYSLMMLGCIFVPKEDHSHYTEDLLLNIVKRAVETQHDKLTIQLIQSRLVNSLYFFARGKLWEAYEHRGLAIRAIGALEMNTEDGLCYFGRDNSLYGFDGAMARECWRQTFWCSLMMDISLLVNISYSYCSTHQQLSALSGRTLCTIQPEDIFLRLPLENDEYEKALSSSAPFLQEIIGSKIQSNIFSNKRMSSKAHLIHLSCIWADVLNNMHRFAHRPYYGYKAAYEVFYEHILSRLTFWQSYSSAAASLDHSSSDAETFTTYPGATKNWSYFFHTIHMMLQRHVRHAVFSQEDIQCNIAACRRHARQLLQVCVDKDKKGKSRSELELHHEHSNMAYKLGRRKQENQNSIFGFPFAGYSIVLASDILSAGGFLGVDLSETIALLDRGIALLSEMAHYWASAAMQRDILIERVRLLRLVESKTLEPNLFTVEGHFWKLSSAMATTFQPVDDICYGLAQKDYFDAIKLDNSGK